MSEFLMKGQTDDPPMMGVGNYANLNFKKNTLGFLEVPIYLHLLMYLLNYFKGVTRLSLF